MQRLIRRKPNEDFFGWFEQAAHNDVEAAQLLDRMCREFVSADETVRQLHDLEHKGDEIAHAVYQKLNKIFMPPLDREDIIAITIALDDVMDHIHEAGDAMCIYNIQEPTAVARQLADSHRRVHRRRWRSRCPIFATAARCGGSRRASSRSTGSRIEADALFRQGTMDLFHQPHDPTQVIAWSRIYETMEKVTDRCEDIADVLRGLVIKHA